MKVLLVLFVVCVILAGCGGGGGHNETVVATGSASDAESTNSGSAIVIFSDDNGEFQLTSFDEPTGSEVERLKVVATASAQNESDIEFDVEEVSQSQTQSQTRAGWNVGRYRCMIRWEPGNVGGCIGRNGWHLNLHIKDRWTNQDLFNAHLISWWQNGPQFGIWNPPSGFCRTTRGTFTNIRKTVRDAISQSTSLPSWAASSIAYTAAVISVAALPFLVW
ncbi:MAG: hypothetical protein M1429_03585 [Patescibacteria group bacterium]|nr:hypothetical protein [Patescibacteria group bacterium]